MTRLHLQLLVLAMISSACGADRAAPAVEPATTSDSPQPVAATEPAEPPTEARPERDDPPLSTFACAGAVGTAEAPPALPPRTQVEVRRLVEWNGEVVLEIPRGLMTLDIATGQLAWLSFDELDAVSDITTWQGRAVALGVAGGAPALRARRDDAWEALVLPEGFGQARLVADARTLVLVQGNNVARSQDGLAWRVIEGAVADTGPRVMHLHDGRLYLGYDRGEFGGGLAIVDLRATPPRTTGGMSQSELPVRAIAADPRGDVWVVDGLAHLGLQLGRLRRFGANGEGVTVASHDGMTDAERGRMREMGACLIGCFGTRGWQLDPSSLEGMALDAQGRPVVLSRAQGPARIENGSLRPITSAWRYDTYWSGMLMHGSTVVVGTYDAGLVVWDLDGTAVRTVCLPPR